MLAFMRLRDRVKESVFGHHGLLILIIKTVTTHFHMKYYLHTYVKVPDTCAHNYHTLFSLLSDCLTIIGSFSQIITMFSLRPWTIALVSEEMKSLESETLCTGHIKLITLTTSFLALNALVSEE